MKYFQKLELSPELARYRSQIEATIQPYIKIRERANNHLNWWQSKFGELPYFPQEMDYPQTTTGEYLSLLAQINFAEVPNLAGFPEAGILQFYIFAEGGYGKDYLEPRKQDWFRVFYILEPTYDEAKLVTNFSFLPEIDYVNNFPISRTCALDFSYELAPLSIRDDRFKDSIGEDLEQLLSNNPHLWNEYDDKFSKGSKIGGYPHFTQDDPRPHFIKNKEPFILLLQIDSSRYNDNICWGDCGVGNFFIQKSALKRLDFDDVFYTWDCS